MSPRCLEIHTEVINLFFSRFKFEFWRLVKFQVTIASNYVNNNNKGKVAGLEYVLQTGDHPPTPTLA